ncbi:MAG: hypothetical protein M3Y26_09495, partial [Actinomycetota bacterium]|nr:hypothetical protein [Actinomycetota bacterium]
MLAHRARPTTLALEGFEHDVDRSARHPRSATLDVGEVVVGGMDESLVDKKHPQEDTTGETPSTPHGRCLGLSPSDGWATDAALRRGT